MVLTSFIKKIIFGILFFALFSWWYLSCLAKLNYDYSLDGDATREILGNIQGGLFILLTLALIVLGILASMAFSIIGIRIFWDWVNHDTQITKPLTPRAKKLKMIK